jgi:hypothetical protein
MQAHDWTIGIISEGDKRNVSVVAVCRRCGEIRAKLISRSAQDKIDLDGECPGHAARSAEPLDAEAAPPEPRARRPA